MSLCRVWNAKCARCDPIARLAYEAKMHSMQWPPDVLEAIWTTLRTGMWRARMKERMWAAVHNEMSEYWDERCIAEYHDRIAEEWGAGMPDWVEHWVE